MSTVSRPTTARPERPDDRTRRARIRDAAIACFAERGVAQTSVRDIAGRAGVTPGLITHHFGSKEALRRECDLYVAATIQQRKLDAMQSEPDFDPIASLRNPVGDAPILMYLARTMTDGTEEVADLVDRLVDDADRRLQLGQQLGMVRPGIDTRSVATVLVAWSLGSVVLHEHVNRLLGVDLTGDLAADPTRTMNYIGPVLEVIGQGLLTAEAHERFRQQFDDAARGSDT